MNLAIWRALRVLHVAARYRLISLLPAHPARWLLVALQYLIPSSWFGPRGLNEGERLERAFHELGPIFIKFGQLLSTRRDLLPPDWTEALARLQDDVPAFPGRQAREIIERELGAPASELFLRFDAEPLASASVAQVHAATLHDGTEVVVKVLRPGVEDTVSRDLRVMENGARWLERLWRDARYFHPGRVVDEYRQIIFGELDLLAEARNADTMRRHFLFSPLLYIPAVHPQYGTRRVMVMDRMYGIPVNDIERIRAAGIEPRVLAERGVEIFFTQVFRYNFFHADMHPGNIFVNPEHPDSPQYIGIDTAIVGRLSQQDLHILGRLALMVMRQDFPGMVELVIRAGWTTVPVDRHALERELRGIVEPIFSLPLDQLEFAPLVMKLFDTARGFRIEAPIQYILLVKTLIHVEGLGRSIYPQLDIWQTARPMLEAWMLEEFGPVATMKKLQARAPEWAAQLPEMPDLLRDALENLRNMPREQRDLEARLEASLTGHRRKLFVGLGGGGLIAAAVVLPPALAAGSAVAGVLALVWATR